MILQAAVLRIKPGEGAQFADAFPQAEKVLIQATGYVSHEVRPCLETPGRCLQALTGGRL